MDRLHEIIGHLREEEYDAVLYGVMRSFLKKQATKRNCEVYDLLLSVDDERETIDVFTYYENSTDEIRLIEEVKPN